MKNMTSQILLAVLSAIALAALSGCAADGTVDTKAVGAAINTGVDAYSNYNHSRQTSPALVGYDAAGNPIYR